MEMEDKLEHKHGAQGGTRESNLRHLSLYSVWRRRSPVSRFRRWRWRDPMAWDGWPRLKGRIRHRLADRVLR